MIETDRRVLATANRTDRTATISARGKRSK
jgi:hypothetical protein